MALPDGNVFGVLSGLVLQPDGSLIAAGTVDGQVALARYTASGELDPGFGDNGVVLQPAPDDAFAWDVALQPDGKIVVAGVGGARAFLLARYEGGE